MLSLRKAIAALPDKQRMVFTMRYYEDLSYERISEITGTSVGALKASYHIAYEKVKQFLLDSD
jgi:RNA polymerase sigma-70 factor (ECF subfamily)